jgi:asparagine synthase (glutamine-hydrolysing)
MLRRDGAPVDRALLQSLTHFLAYVGPDAQQTWAEGSIGFGHTLLRTTWESAAECQPANLEQRFWITADVRLDCRAELEGKLKSAGQRIRTAAPDSELVLGAYAVWGEACVQELRGDFAFAIWDARKRSLFCARDHFGIKPFYYADLGDIFVFGNTLDCVRLHPVVSNELNDQAVGDFLLFGLNYDQATTTFRDVRRLPAAHVLSVSAKGLRAERYWFPPVDGRIRYRRPDQYIENFRTLIQAAVADRLRTSRVGILLSGGLDSSSIAATIRELSVKSGETTDLRAYTVTYESLLPDREGHYAREIAEFLRIPIRFLPLDGLQLFERWGDPEFSCPEPVDDPLCAGLFDLHRLTATECRVVLEGEGSDNLMYFKMWPYVRYLQRNGEWGRSFVETVRYLRRRPSIWPGVRRRLGGVFRGTPAPGFPQWVAKDFVKRMNLEDRWKELGVVRATPAHPAAPKAHASLLLPHWSRIFEMEYGGVTRCPIEIRHPFLDLRIVNYILALPPFPWSFQKTLLREAMAGHLPDTIRLRPKTPLAGDPLVKKLERPVNRARWMEQIERYVNIAALPVLQGETNAEVARTAIRPLCLNFWLQSSGGVRYKLKEGIRHA